jgi:alpha-mannosidase
LAFIQKPKEGRGFVVFMAGPSVISCNNGGEMELVVMRNTRKEKAFGIFPLMGFPAAGADHDKQTLDYAVLPTDSGGWWENRLHKLGESVLHPHWRDPEEAAMMALSDSLIMIDNEELSIMAIKRAQRGDGLIVRLFMPFPKGEEVILAMKNRDIKEASLCDARERDREKIAVKNGKALVPLHNPITTARLQF